MLTALGWNRLYRGLGCVPTVRILFVCKTLFIYIKTIFMPCSPGRPGHCMVAAEQLSLVTWYVCNPVAEGTSIPYCILNGASVRLAVQRHPLCGRRGCRAPARRVVWHAERHALAQPVLESRRFPEREQVGGSVCLKTPSWAVQGWGNFVGFNGIHVTGVADTDTLIYVLMCMTSAQPPLNPPPWPALQRCNEVTLIPSWSQSTHTHHMHNFSMRDDC